MATSISADTEVAEFAGQLLFRLWRASHERTAEALESIDMTPALFGILNFLGARKGTIQQEIGAAMGIDPSTMVSLIDDLEKAGLAKRRPHPSDRRAREVSITPKGRRVLERCRKLALKSQDEVLRGLTTAERRQLLKLLRRALSEAPPQTLWSSSEGTKEP
jgi:DNA-binding MarR family transcriptional regulator